MTPRQRGHPPPQGQAGLRWSKAAPLMIKGIVSDFETGFALIPICLGE
jgi:hypothetical protein